MLAPPSAKKKKISFRAKTETKCPVCGNIHAKEELMSGGGRLIAGKLTEELRRLFEESKKWGKIYPLAYEVQVCPKCLYASYSKDFDALGDEEVKSLKMTISHRQKMIQTIFGTINFAEDRNLVSGAASYLLATDCYHLRVPEIAPTPKKAVSCMRAAWLLDDLFADASYRPYDKVRDFYYTEASRNYRLSLEFMESGREPIESVAHMLGPDIDQNWAFDGIIYLNAYLTRKYIDNLADSPTKKKELLENTKRYLSKLYGSGKASKSKPSVIIDMAKDLYDAMSSEIAELEARLNPEAASSG